MPLLVRNKKKKVSALSKRVDGTNEDSRGGAHHISFGELWRVVRGEPLDSKHPFGSIGLRRRRQSQKDGKKQSLGSKVLLLISGAAANG